MEFILQLLAQLFSAPVEETNTSIIKEEVKVVDPVKEEMPVTEAEEQLEPNLFNVLDFH